MGDADSITISLLPVSLSLSISPPHLPQVTCNEVEVSLFAEHDTLQEFHDAARKDARRLRKRRSHSPRPPQKRVSEIWEPVEVTQERWKVLQIDSHSDTLDSSGARVHELSAPLAAAGISILYQSSYMSDFIFVKEARLTEVMSLLGSAGFDLYLSDPTHLTAQVSAFTSPLMSPVGIEDQAFDFSHSGRNSLDTDGGIVFTRSRSNTNGTTSSSGSRSRGGLSQRMTSPLEDAFPALVSDDAVPTLASPTADSRPYSTRSNSHSPSACDVRVLSPDITYVGLSDDSAETWGLKIVKLVAFPELIMGSARASAHDGAHPPRRYSSAPRGAPPGAVSERKRGREWERHHHTRRARVSKKDPADRESSASPTFDAEQDTSVDPSVADDDDGDDEQESGRPTLRHLDSVQTARPPARGMSLRSRSVSVASTSSSISEPEPLVPFFSFTRTQEGSSLAAPVSLLATLFPASERHMVMCSQELDVVDSRNASPERWAEEDQDGDDDDNADGELPPPSGSLKCLQIDLRKFGLEKHGLVNRFSERWRRTDQPHVQFDVQDANLLVDKAHANRAQALLRSC
ncbi:uncharacterized protein BXZ73DRAFT_87636 [Epithele typhae]|uniref:uncharacterized protein n=1 Tax=Epithele typhae TaxID=378194 RepID=UPI0020081F5A|nr:uncharacterized protein BXZ73DRAFT_87636 [Epithele typhae]KAH9943271.1 hypothetical protein BXZ73DRAFT_87636 [Epithele typhae]